MTAADSTPNVNPSTDEESAGILIEAQEALVQGRLVESIDGFSRVLEKNPSHQMALFSRGTAFFRNGQFDQAHADFNQVLSTHPRKEKILCARGNVYMVQENFEKALEDFNKALDYNPQYATAYLNRAIVLAML